MNEWLPAVKNTGLYPSPLSRPSSGMDLRALPTRVRPTRGQRPRGPVPKLAHRRLTHLGASQGYRICPAWFRGQPDLVRHRDGIRPARLDGQARPHQSRRPAVGTETAPTASVHHPRHTRANNPPDPAAHVQPCPRASTAVDAITRLDSLTASPTDPRPPTAPTTPAPPGPVEPPHPVTTTG